MQIQISAQCFYFFYSIILGFFLGILYEPLRIVRIALKHSPLAVGIQDFFFCLISAFLSILLFFAYGNGTIRWFALCGIFLGGYFYFLTLGRLISRLSEQIIAAIRRFCNWIFRRFLLPAFRFTKALYQKLMVIAQRMKKRYRQHQAKRYDRLIRSGMPIRASRGFKRR